MLRKPQVIDFFCGAGGFSEGFRQQGFEVVMGVDNWLPAVETHNFNHRLNDKIKDVLDFESVEEIDALPDTEVIIGSPPCVLFSLSNKGGKADKSLGIRLIESFLRVVAVKKHKPSSRLKAWFMENVPNSKNYVKAKYTFNQLGLRDWAKGNGINPNSIAINGSANGHILNTADFGVSQRRERFLCGEIVKTGSFPRLEEFKAKKYITIGSIKDKMPRPNLKSSSKEFADPNYPSLKFKIEDITDHFYDSGIYESQWQNAKYLKINHPFMGKMAFPEDDKNPSRTIMATRSMTTREALIYKSEYERKGNGEYRLPTIREIATLMGFPYSYQFYGAENTKWRQIGNAVCPFMSAALAKSVRQSMGLPIIGDSMICFNRNASTDSCNKIQNLNTFTEKIFNNAPKRKMDARFRRHPFKDGNMTVALTNFNPIRNSDSVTKHKRWYSSVFVGCGSDFKIRILPEGKYEMLSKMIIEHGGTLGKKFIQDFEKNYKSSFGGVSKFQDAYVLEDISSPFEPTKLVDDIGKFIDTFDLRQKVVEVASLAPGKTTIPMRQLFAMYAINRLVS